MSGIATAVVGSAIIGGVVQSKAASKAAGAQTYAADQSAAESQRQFDEIQKLLAPYVQAGTSSLSQQQALLGLSGPGAQQAAISGIEGSPQFSALMQQGENAILQNASATGGLRGGNTQAALAKFRPALLSQLIDQQYTNLGGLTSIGQNAAAGVGNAGLTTSGRVIDAYNQAGAANAGNYLAQGAAINNTIGGVVGGLARVDPNTGNLGWRF